MMSSEDFMRAVFLHHGAQERPCIAGQFPGGACPAETWPEHRICSYHTHYSIGMFEYPQIGVWRRKNCFWTGLQLFVLDDVGEKVPEPGIAPTFIIETKPGSQQWGYLLQEPIRSPSAAETVIGSLVNAGLSDPGAKGRSRLFRLPGSKPPGKLHVAKLIHADWDRRARPDVNAILQTFGVKKSVTRASTRKPVLMRGEAGLDPMLEWLMDNGRVIGTMQSDGWWPIVCPWADQHTDGDLSGTRYKTPTKADAVRSFKCHHGHCEHRRFTDFVNAFRRAGGPLVATLPGALSPEEIVRMRSPVSSELMAMMIADVKRFGGGV